MGLDFFEDTEGCSTIIALGTATVDGKTRIGQAHEGIAHGVEFHLTRVMRIHTDTATGIKWVAELNSQGVARQERKGVLNPDESSVELALLTLPRGKVAGKFQ